MIPISEPTREPAPGGFALFALGFRPFYLLAALFSAVAVLVWLVVLRGEPWRGFLSPLAWHQHEMTFGFALAVVAGFLLTAGRVWTGLRTPEVQGQSDEKVEPGKLFPGRIAFPNNAFAFWGICMH